MRLTVKNDVFVVECTFADKDTVKAASFRWHGAPCTFPKCKACAAGIKLKVWWTDRRENAARLVHFADDGAKAALNGHVTAVAASRAADVSAEEVTNLPVPAGRSYLPFQRAGIAYAMKQLRSGRRGVLVADEMGLGKTIQALGIVNCDETAGKVLVLCPASLRQNWKREAERWLVKPRNIHVVEGAGVIPADADMVVVNYDKLVDRETWGTVFKRIAKYIAKGITADPGDCSLTDGNGMLLPTVLGQLRQMTFDYVVADEAHYMKNPKSARTQMVLGAKKGKYSDGVQGLIDNAKHFVALTGTPILNRPIEIYPLLAALEPREFGDFFKFAKRYCAGYQRIIGRGKLAWDFTGSSNLDELQERLRATVMVRRLKKDVLTDLPAKRRQIIPLLADKADAIIRREEEALNTLMSGRLDTKRANLEIAAEMDDAGLYAQAVAELEDGVAASFTEMAALRHDTAVAKVPAVIEHLQNLLDEGLEKVIVFAHHKDVITALLKAFPGSVSITGDTAMGERQNIVDRFQTDPTCQVFIGNIQAAGVGLTLTAASTVVFAELDWVPGNVTQAEDRAHRIGQKESVLVQHLVLDGSLDARMANYIVMKQNIADAALDNKAAPVVAAAIPAAAKRTAPKASDADREAATAAVQLLAAMCDGAAELDGAGFNKIDTDFGKRLAGRSYQRPLTDGEVLAAKKLASRYRRQLPDDLRAALKIN